MSQLDPLHYINIGPQGTFKASGELQTSPQAVDALIAHLEANPVDHLTLHFHGGLVSEKAGAEVADRLVPVYKAAGTHPVMFIWEAGLVETLKENLTTIHSTELVQLIIKFALQKLESAFGEAIGMKGSAEQLSLDEIEGKLGEEDPFSDQNDQAQKAAEGMDIFSIKALEGRFETELLEQLAVDPDIDRLLEKEVPETDLLDPDFKEEVVDEGGSKGGVVEAFIAKKLTKILVTTIKRFKNKTDHGIYPTVMEELLREMYMADFGAWVWGSMKKKASEMWLPNEGPVTEFSRVGDYFLSKLAALPNPPALNLTGHSTGGIVICPLLDAMASRYPALKARNIAMMAPACRSELFHEHVASKPERFENFRMFTMQDGFETQDRLVPGVYTRSLLYLVSGILEDKPDAPILGMVRYTSGQPPYTGQVFTDVRNFLLEEGRNRVVLSKTHDSAKEGYKSFSLKHGDFDNDSATLESVRQFLAE